MTPPDSTQSFQAWLANRSLSVKGLTIPALLDAALEFYESVPCVGLVSDMLLFQWGVCDWGEGEHFEFDLTRQFIEESKQDGDAISHFRITAYFEPTPMLRSIVPGNQWCEQVAHVEQLRRFVEHSQAYRAVMGQVPGRVAVAWSPV